MRRLTTAWTDAHAWLIILAAALVGLTYVSTSTPTAGPTVTLVTLATIVGSFALASFSDAFGGLIVGLASAAIYTALHQYAPESEPTSFVRQAAVLALLLLTGLSSGIVADRIRRGRRIAARVGDQAVLPVAGSLGLISAEDAAQVLADETTRAELHSRPLTTATVTVHITDDALASEDVRRAWRAVARALESELRVTDIVYAASDGVFGVILPETISSAAADVIEPALMLARSASFADRGVGHRRVLTDAADLTLEVTPVVTPAPPRRPTASRPRKTAATRSGSRAAEAKAG